ncbi:MAG TPA: hypothetical protein VM925_25600 [Labilithrix sp.]|nr:hypothetical protein [Labilithrix sp.]
MLRYRKCARSRLRARFDVVLEQRGVELLYPTARVQWADLEARHAVRIVVPRGVRRSFADPMDGGARRSAAREARFLVAGRHPR